MLAEISDQAIDGRSLQVSLPHNGVTAFFFSTAIRHATQGGSRRRVGNAQKERQPARSSQFAKMTRWRCETGIGRGGRWAEAQRETVSSMPGAHLWQGLPARFVAVRVRVL
ncbi:unnamed protein product [Polarella glacialis]|uniref:Uncharacterized protein n=1 Tax=Polarella glacialis TaxID=89957 RepID=A0A813JQL9_POLGL|nr:unnamed protein product [Polarella glacialis]